MIRNEKNITCRINGKQQFVDDKSVWDSKTRCTPKALFAKNEGQLI